jgi:ABC-2 type transport system permease protein
MTAMRALVRRHLIETRWVLGLSACAFFGLSWLTAWMARGFERLIDSGELGPAVRRFGFLRGLGGPAMDYSTTALEVCWWNHPLIVLTVLAWAITRGSTAVAGEIERGTLDVTLSRPVSRPLYLASQVAFTALGFLLLAAGLIGGNLWGGMLYSLKSPPGLLTLLKPAAMVVSMGLAVYGYTLPLSAADTVRWRPAFLSAAVTLGGLLGMSLAPQFEGYWFQDLLEYCSVFRAYAPVTVAVKGESLGTYTAVLLLIFSVGAALSAYLFVRRDLPSNS